MHDSKIIQIINFILIKPNWARLVGTVRKESSMKQVSLQKGKKLRLGEWKGFNLVKIGFNFH